MKISTPISFALLLVLIISVGISEAQPLQSSVRGGKQQQNRSGESLPESQLLMENDSLFPTQSRTQAMSLERETGHLTPAEDAVLIPMLRRRQQQPQVTKPRQQQPQVTKPRQQHRVAGPLIRNY